MVECELSSSHGTSRSTINAGACLHARRTSEIQQVSSLPFHFPLCVVRVILHVALRRLLSCNTMRRYLVVENPSRDSTSEDSAFWCRRETEWARRANSCTSRYHFF